MFPDILINLIINFINLHSAVFESLHTGRQTKKAKPISAFLQLLVANAPKAQCEWKAYIAHVTVTLINYYQAVFKIITIQTDLKFQGWSYRHMLRPIIFQRFLRIASVKFVTSDLWRLTEYSNTEITMVVLWRSLVQDLNVLW